ncbi:preprotein translocase subunit SecG [Haploplasma modicum]|jgi:preprotein translocase subunit SecG|uniref:preprotein translocase subunit SecG n=1 Tax=Haploplasma modicum TaxID=2150 RepID=UPI000553375B|nr:preprotein translocase subunit SecG [Haploplasma modicum]MCR1809028.1 preprotein translocase subunit SecG [Haploplasma modicum]
MNLFDWLALATGIILTIFVLLQQGDDDIQDAFSGEKSELFKNRKIRGFDLFMLRGTTVLAILFIAFVIVSNVMHANF